MTRGDIRHAVEVGLNTWPDKTQQEIAEQVGCNRSYLVRIQDELVTSNKLTLSPRTRARSATPPMGKFCLSVSLASHARA